jgi:putative membrane protein
MLQPALKKNDRKANIFIITVSVIVFTAVIALSRIKLEVNLPFDPHLFALANATINSFVSVFLLAALWAVRKRNYVLHKKLMLVAIVLSVLFLVCYIAHHLFTHPTSFGDLDHDGVLSDAETAQVGVVKTIYYILLFTHIPLAGIILPFILFTAYRALTGEYTRHKKLARYTWPIWFYVAVSGVVVYLMIQPYY